MIDSVQNKIYFNEVMTPKQKSDDIEKDLEKFATKYDASLENDFIICITDNPMGLLSFEAFETIEVTEMDIKPERLLIHLNAFHRKDDFDRILKTMYDNGVKNILAISGDGDERLHRLSPEELGYDVNCITSVELIKYIKREYPDFFRFGVAYNHYEPAESEREKMKRKIEAGAEFIITQPVIRKHENIDWLKTV
ncbi:methylenetetrahydrofolate reductase, partial [bacterium]|nr:methylenetetrahydrofolate reductase [bacterium]